MRILHLLGAVAGLSVAACGTSVDPDGGMDGLDGARPDGGTPSDAGTDAGPPGCTADGECDDGVDCTADTCTVATGTCRHQVVPALCPAGSSCHPVRGCEMGRPCADDEDCADEDACTTNERCDPAARVCVVDPLDGDADGDPPRVCGGGDCDDSDPLVYAGAAERCNTADDDCDGRIDEGADAACGERRVCLAGACECGASYTDCFGTCDDLQTSASNCGMCGQSCGSGTCSAGSCRCSTGQEFCGAAGCIDVSSDASHCGACDRPCGSLESCVGGSCIGCDTPGSPCCGGPAGYCGSGLLCEAGTCVSCGGWGERCCTGSPRCSSSATTLTCVSDTCVHCGELREPCCVGRSPSCYFYACSGGFCGGCSAPYTVCDGLCVDTEYEHDHCGACGNACSSSEICSSGSCIACGTEGITCCEGACGTGLACIDRYSGSGGTCRRTAACSPTMQTGCRTGEACYMSFSDGTIYCAPAGTGVPGSSCTQDTDCAPGSGCEVRGGFCMSY